MRIGHLCHKYPLGAQVGAPFVHELARATAALGHEVHVLVPRSGREAATLEVDGVLVHQRLRPLKLMNEMSVDDAYVQRPRLGMARFLWTASVELYRLAHRLKLDVVHAHWAVPMGLVATASRWLHRVPVLITSHGRDLYLNALDGVTRRPGWASPFTRFALRSADHVIFTTSDYLEFGEQYGVKKDRRAVIPNGVDVALFHPADGADGVNLRSRLGIAQGDCMLLFVGSLDEKKGLMVLLEALADLVASSTPVHLVMVGDGPLRAAIENRAKDLGVWERVSLMGRMEHRDLPPIFGACDVYVQPSLVEPFGVVVLEAAACQKAVVATDVQGMRSVVDDGIGVLVPPGDAGALATAIEKLLLAPDLRHELGRRARLRVEAGYSWQSVAQATVDRYEQLLAGRPGAS
jgi:glycosyltransferase involved in cell wall biosynthesis